MRTALVSLLIAAVALLVACGGEEVVGGCDPCPPGKTFQPLTAREHVLNNLELSCNERVVAQFDTLLDDEFTFHFSPGDVGGVIPEQWGRAEELKIASLLFDPGLDDPDYPTCQSIRVDFKFESGVQWVEVFPPGAGGEVRYTTTVYYEFSFEFDAGQTYIAVPGSQAQLTVCNAGTVDAPQWRLVAWQDLGSGSAALRSGASAEPSAWGDIKALYIGAVFQREQVLSGLELSYNQRNITRLVELLDDNFTFFFSPGDVGGSIPEQWGRVEEATATSRLLDRYLNDPNYPTCLFLQIDIKIEDGVQWVDVIPEDFPDEIWHTTTVEYASAFLIYPDVVYISARGSLAQFTIRNTGTGDAPEWRLVEWRDLGSNSVAVRAAVAGATWGSIKALYR